MSQPPCGHIEAIIQKITEDLQATDVQLHVLEVEEMNLLDPRSYVERQRQVDRLARKKRSLQGAWDRHGRPGYLQVSILSLFFYGFIDAFFHALCLSYRKAYKSFSEVGFLSRTAEGGRKEPC